jgi:hypothetical protein
MKEMYSDPMSRSMLLMGLGDVLKGGSGSGFLQYMAQDYTMQQQEEARRREMAQAAQLERQRVQDMQMARDAFTRLNTPTDPNSSQGIADAAMTAIGHAPMPRIDPARAFDILQSPHVPQAVKDMVRGQFGGGDPVKGVEVDGRLVNPINGQVIYEGQPEGPEYGFNDGYYYDKNNPQAGANPLPGLPNENGGDMTEIERRIFMFNNIQSQTGPAINAIEDNGFNPANIQDKLSDGILGGNFFKSTEGQMYNAAAGAWAESALRLATGAAATPEEYTRIRNMYFAAEGDSPATIALKRAMRESYQNVLRATLNGDINQQLPNPLVFAIEQFYAMPRPNESGQDGGMSLEDALNIGREAVQ